MNTTKRLIAACLLICLFSCKKNGEEGQKPKTNVSEFELMGVTGKRWPLYEITLTYYGAAGAVDSTVKIEPTAVQSTLFFGDNKGVNGIYKNFDAQDPLNKVFPGFGRWSLNRATQEISFTCISPYCNGTDGDWQIIYYNIHYQPTVEFLNIERTVSLPNGRSVKQLIELMIY